MNKPHPQQSMTVIRLLSQLHLCLVSPGLPSSLPVSPGPFWSHPISSSPSWSLLVPLGLYWSLPVSPGFSSTSDQEAGGIQF